MLQGKQTPTPPTLYGASDHYNYWEADETGKSLIETRIDAAGKIISLHVYVTADAKTYFWVGPDHIEKVQRLQPQVFEIWSVPSNYHGSVIGAKSLIDQNTLEYWYGYDGSRHRYVLQPRTISPELRAEIRARARPLVTNAWNIVASQSAAAAQYAQMAAAERARDQAESDAFDRRQAMMGSLNNAIQMTGDAIREVTSAQAAQAHAELQATIAQQRAAQDAAAQAAQQQAQTQQGQARIQQAPSTPSHQPPKTQHGTAGITLHAPAATTSAPAAATQSATRFTYCHAREIAQGSKGDTFYFSAIAAGTAPDATSRFQGQIRNQYPVNGPLVADCSTASDRATAESHQDSNIRQMGGPGVRQVMTGIDPTR